MWWRQSPFSSSSVVLSLLQTIGKTVEMAAELRINQHHKYGQLLCDRLLSAAERERESNSQSRWCYRFNGCRSNGVPPRPVGRQRVLCTAKGRPGPVITRSNRPSSHALHTPLHTCYTRYNCAPGTGMTCNKCTRYSSRRQCSKKNNRHSIARLT